MVVLGSTAGMVPDHVGELSLSSSGWLLGFITASVLTYAIRGLYKPRRRIDSIEVARQTIIATSLAASFAISTWAILHHSAPDARDSVLVWASACIFVAAGRIALGRYQANASSNGESLYPTLIVGAGRIGSLIAKRLLQAPEFGLNPVAFLDKEPLNDTSDELDVPVVGASWDLDGVIERFGIKHVIVSFSTAPEHVLLRIVRRCEDIGVSVAIVPRLFERMPTRYSMEHIGSIPLVSPQPADPHAWQFALKYALDRVAAATALLLLSPLLLTISVAVLVSMGRPVLFRQARVGRDGQVFEMFKFRSMRGKESPHLLLHAASGEALGPGGVEGEDRRTRVGSFLRQTSLDELAQLMNVVKGEMSLIGPRPERPRYASTFEQTVYRYGDRHRVKSGITGWAQVHGLRGRTSVADRAEWDNFYIENFSLWLDVVIALRTLAVLCRPFRSNRSSEPAAVLVRSSNA
jgi:exopolysaccharide biosynthesis polyprenyl glycosylphosphotransferase